MRDPVEEDVPEWGSGMSQDDYAFHRTTVRHDGGVSRPLPHLVTSLSTLGQRPSFRVTTCTFRKIDLLYQL
jgi:hypothetical protein